MSKEKSIPATLYLYKRYCSDENTEVFTFLCANMLDAENQLRNDVESSYRMSFDEMKNDPMFDGDTIRKDYVEIHNDSGTTSFFVVEKKTVDMPESILLELEQAFELAVKQGGGANA